MIYAYFGKCEAKYFGLFVADNDATAIRIVEDELQRNQKFQNYASEYSLYCLANFNDDSAEIIQNGLNTIRLVSDLSDILLNYIVRQRRQHELLKNVSGVEIEDEGFSSPVQVSDFNPTQNSNN